MIKKEISSITPVSREEWRNWLKKNHDKMDAVWLIYYKQKAGKQTVFRDDAVDEALCFGWIDGLHRPLDEERAMQLYTRRRPNGTWSKVNKDKIEKLIGSGLMAQPGLDCIKAAQANGSWTLLDEVEQLIVPPDLEHAFAQSEGTKDFYLGLSKSTKKRLLQWLVLAKRPETREKRIREIVLQAESSHIPKECR